jgi:hypothetical protein
VVLYTRSYYFVIDADYFKNSERKKEESNILTDISDKLKNYQEKWRRTKRINIVKEIKKVQMKKTISDSPEEEISKHICYRVM